MVNSVNNNLLYSLLTQSDSSSQLTSSEMFKKLTEEVGGDGKTITKDQLETYISKVESDTSGTEDKGKLGFLKQLDKNWDKISNGSDSITSADLKAGASYLAPPSQSQSSSSSSSSSYLSDSTTSLFTSLSDAVGADSKGVTKSDLATYLKSLVESLSSNSDSDKDSTDSTKPTTTTGSTASTSSTSDTKELGTEISLLTNLLANFDSLSNDSGYITQDTLASGLKEPQDPSTITSGQLQSPIDIRV